MGVVISMKMYYTTDMHAYIHLANPSLIAKTAKMLSFSSS